jgi:hypothetical protein
VAAAGALHASQLCGSMHAHSLPHGCTISISYYSCTLQPSLLLHVLTAAVASKSFFFGIVVLHHHALHVLMVRCLIVPVLECLGTHRLI